MFDDTQIRSRAWIVKEVVDYTLLRDNLKVEKMFLVGSYARGEQNDWSDIDFLIQLTNKGGLRYPTWQQVQYIHQQISSRVHVIFGTEEAQKSLLEKNGNKYSYKEIPLTKESLC